MTAGTIKYTCESCQGSRYIGEGRGLGVFRVQCSSCRAWQWVRVDTGEDLATLQRLVASSNLLSS